ncbi:MAG: hypothetical protein KAI17_19410, partial [Thiotrichaceae bacterium]|nr:hypothetical protein [Thiotrichaceae bacterium]
MKFYSLIILSFILAFMSSCSQRATSTAKISLTLGNIIDSSRFTGGAIVTGINKSNGDRFSFIPTDSDGNETNDDVVTLSNGDWDFEVVAWLGDGAFTIPAMTGIHQCATLSKTLSGADEPLDFVTSATKCGDTHFSNTFNLDSGQLHAFNFKSCDKFPESFDAAIACDTGGTNEGSVNSIRITLHGGSIGPLLEVSSTDLISQCIPDGNFSTSGVFIPTGTLAVGIYTSIEYFTDNNCMNSGTPDKANYFKGLQNVPPFDSKLENVGDVPYFYFSDTPSNSNMPPVLHIVGTAGTDISTGPGDGTTTYTATALSQYHLAHLDARDGITNRDFDSGGDTLQYKCTFDNTSNAQVIAGADCATI